MAILAVLSKRGDEVKQDDSKKVWAYFILPDVVAYNFSLESIYGAGTRYVHMAEQLVNVYIFLTSGVVCTIYYQKRLVKGGGGEEGGGRGWVLQPFCFYHSHFYEREGGNN